MISEFQEAWRKRKGRRLQEARFASDLTTAEVAANIGVSPSTVENWEAGRSWPVSEAVYIAWQRAVGQ